MKIFLTTAVCFFLAVSAKAIDCEGYIINAKKDTIKGVVEVTKAKGVIDRSDTGIDFGDMEMEIKFSEGGTKAKKYKAGDISGYGYKKDGIWYHFEVLDMAKNSGQKSPKLLGKFVNNFRVFMLRFKDGALPMYWDYWNSENSRKDFNTGRETVTGFSQNADLYVKTDEYGYVEIAPTTLGGNKKLKDFLTKYLKLEDEFLKTVDDKAKFTDAEEVLKRYNEWKTKK